MDSCFREVSGVGGVGVGARAVRIQVSGLPSNKHQVSSPLLSWLNFPPGEVGASLLVWVVFCSVAHELGE